MSKHKHKKREERHLREDISNQSSPISQSNLNNQGQYIPNNNPINQNQGINQGVNQNPVMNQINPLMSAISQSLFGGMNQNNSNNNMNMNSNNQMNNNLLSNNPIVSMLQNASNHPIFQLLSNIDLNLLYKLFLGGGDTSLGDKMNSIFNTSNNSKSSNTASDANKDVLKEETIENTTKVDQDPLEVYNSSVNEGGANSFSSTMLGETLSELLKNLDERGVDELVKNVDDDKVSIIMKGLGFEHPAGNTRVEEHLYSDENKGVFIKTSTISGMSTYNDNSRVNINDNDYFATDIIELLQDIMNPLNVSLLDEVMKIRNDFLKENNSGIIKKAMVKDTSFHEITSSKDEEPIVKDKEIMKEEISISDMDNDIKNSKADEDVQK